MKATISKTTQMHIEKRGGHLGYISRRETPLGSHRWLDYYLCEAFMALERAVF